MAELRTMDRTGDSKVIWDKDKPDEVAAAKATFEALKKKRYLAYAVKKDGEKGRVIDEFDPDAEKIILAPQMVGG